MTLIDENGQTSLHCACSKSDNTGLIKHLVCRGGDFTVRDAHGQSPIMLAAEHYEVDFFCKLSEALPQDSKLKSCLPSYQEYASAKKYIFSQGLHHLSRLL